jgi:hypothetical protein
MEKEKYIKPVVKKETLEAEVLSVTHGSPNNGGTLTGGGFTVSGWQFKKNWH